MTQSMGHQARLAHDTATPFDGSSNWFDFVSHTLGKKSTIMDTNSIMGTRSHNVERTRAGLDDVSGQIVLYPSPESLDYWIPHILGAAEGASDVFSLAETLITFYILADNVDDVYLFSDCYINTATFRGTTGSNFVELTLDIIAKTRTNGQSWPAALTSAGIPTGSNSRPYVFTDGVLTLQSGAREFTDFELILDNALNVDFRNSTTATDIDPGDRVVTLNANVPAISDNSALVDQANDGAAGTLVFTNGSFSTTFTFGALQSPQNDPAISGKGPIPYNLSMVARKTGSTDELEITNVPA